MLSMGRDKAVNSSKTYSNRSFKTSEDSNFMCPTCRTSHEDLKIQISQLKEKAHQSFMQVLQIQQLHEEEVNQMREEWQEKEHQLVQTVSSLQEEIKRLTNQMQQLQKNVKRHSYDFEVRELVIDNIEAIGCEDGDRSYLDESALIQFKELLTVKNASDYVASLRREIYRDFKFISNNKTQIEKLFIVIKQLKDQNSQLHKVNEFHKEKIIKAESQIKQIKVALESSQRQNKFISENLKRLGNDKFNLERKVSELEKARSHEDIMSPSILRTKKGQREDSSEKSDKVLQILQEVSELSIANSKREINELNYAKFMCVDQIEQDMSPIQGQMRKSPRKKLIN